MLRGRIQDIRQGHLIGWLWDDEYPDKHVEFDLLVDGEVVGRFVAARPRNDLQQRGIGRGDHAFRIALSTDVIANPNARYSIQVDKQPVPSISAYSQAPALAAVAQPGSDRSELSAAMTAAPVRGKIESVSGDEIVGWLFEAETGGPVPFELAVNGWPVGEYVADQPRDPPQRVSVPAGSQGFAIKLQPDWLTATENKITVRPLSRRAPLPSEMTIIVYSQQQVDRWKEKGGELVALTMSKPAGASAGQPLLPREMATQMREWTTSRLAAFHTTLEKDVLLERAKRLFRDRKWPELTAMLETTSPDRSGRIDLDLLIGRALLYEGKLTAATSVLTRLANQVPNHAAASFYASVATSRAGEHRRASEFGRAALRMEPDNAQFCIEHAMHGRRYARAVESEPDLRRDLLLESIAVFDRALEIDDRRQIYCMLQKARSQAELDLFQDAVDTIDQLLAIEPEHIDGLALKGQGLVALGRFKEAADAVQEIIAIDPTRQGYRFQLRSLQLLAEGSEPREPTFGTAEWRPASATIVASRAMLVDHAVALEEIGSVGTDAPCQQLLDLMATDWIQLSPQHGVAPALGTDLFRLARARAGRSGRLIYVCAGGDEIVVWRRDLLLGLIESGILSGLGELDSTLAGIGPMVETTRLEAGKTVDLDLPSLIRPVPTGTVLLMSRHGVVKFGGGEQFLDSMADHYDAMGFDSIIVGTRPDRMGESGREGNRSFAFIAAEAAAVRDYVLKVRPAVVHVLSGLGFQVAEALEFLNIPIIYGIHFWRDCLGTSDDQRFFLDLDKGPIPKETFRHVIETASCIYSNSEYTRSVMEEAFALRTPLIYSLPREVSTTQAASQEEADVVLEGWRDYVLLVNAKPDKGFDLILQVATAVPRANFLVVASQSERDEAQAAIQSAGLLNVRVIGHTDRMDVLYSHARAVAVPSYKFVETFSRVCIEAQRHGKPVIGSDIGNVPYLLNQSGVVLPERSGEWALEIQRLYDDGDYYRSRCDAALENSRRYGFHLQAEALNGVIFGLASRILIGVGSGIGNMLHVAPMIRNISRRLGCKVDLVVNEDHPGSLFVLHNDKYVNSVFALRPEVLRRRYHTVFLTHSFGSTRPIFQAKHVLNSRDWINFEAAGPYHETVYNLEAARHLLGIPYDDDDTKESYLGNFSYRRPTGKPVRIGIHGGSKDGFWVSKRWPGHAELAERLLERGFDVASFGLPAEYVPGTEDMTGGSIQEMVGSMLNVDYFVSNDSGLMNICNALGVPVMALFAPTNPTTRAPLGVNSRWISLNKSCSPCEVTPQGRKTFQAGECRCIAEISVDDVERAVLAHLAALDGASLPPVRS